MENQARKLSQYERIMIPEAVIKQEDFDVVSEMILLNAKGMTMEEAYPIAKEIVCRQLEC